MCGAPTEEGELYAGVYGGVLQPLCYLQRRPRTAGAWLSGASFYPVFVFTRPSLLKGGAPLPKTSGVTHPLYRYPPLDGSSFKRVSPNFFISRTARRCCCFVMCTKVPWNAQFVNFGMADENCVRKKSGLGLGSVRWLLLLYKNI